MCTSDVCGLPPEYQVVSVINGYTTVPTLIMLPQLQLSITISDGAAFNVAGTAYLAGTLSVSVDNVGDSGTLTLFTYGDHQGQFDQVLISTNSCEEIQVENVDYQSNQMTVTYTTDNSACFFS